MGPIGIGGFRELNPGPLAPEASIMPLYQIPVTHVVQGVGDILYRITGRETFFLSVSSFSLPNTAAIAVTALLLFIYLLIVAKKCSRV